MTTEATFLGVTGYEELVDTDGPEMEMELEEGTNVDPDADVDIDRENPFQMAWYFKLTYIVLYVSMIVVAIVGNCCVIYVIVTNRSMRTVTHYFIVNLSVSDILLATFNALFMMIYLMESNWLFGQFYCRIALFLAPLLISSSIFTYTCLALDRYMAIVKLVRLKPTPRKMALTLFGIWSVSAGIASPNLVYATVMFAGRERVVCTLHWPDGVQSTSDRIYNLFLIGVNYVAPLLIMTIAYTKICMVLWGSGMIGEWNRQQEQSVKAKRKLVKMLIACVAIFALCWSPMHTYQIITYISEAPHWKYVNHLYLIIYFIAMCNTVCPPIIYCQLNAKFLAGFTAIQRKLCCKPKLIPMHMVGVGIGSTRCSAPNIYLRVGRNHGRSVSLTDTAISSVRCEPLNRDRNRNLDSSVDRGRHVSLTSSCMYKRVAVSYDMKGSAVTQILEETCDKHR